MTEDVRRGAVRELKWLSHTLKNIVALGDDAEAWADAEKHAKEAETRENYAAIAIAKLEARKAELEPEVKALEAKRDEILAVIEAARQRIDA